MGRPSARPTHDLTSLIISSIERIAALCGVAPTLKEQHMWTGCVALVVALRKKQQPSSAGPPAPGQVIDTKATRIE